MEEGPRLRGGEGHGARSCGSEKLFEERCDGGSAAELAQKKLLRAAQGRSEDIRDRVGVVPELLGGELEARIVVGLEQELGVDPFRDGASPVQTFGQLVSIYEKACEKQSA